MIAQNENIRKRKVQILIVAKRVLWCSRDMVAPPCVAAISQEAAH
jgi:hypothetical protein